MLRTSAIGAFLFTLVLHVSCTTPSRPPVHEGRDLATPETRAELARLSPIGFLPVIVRMRAQLSPEERGAALAGATGEKRREVLVEALKAHARREQREVLEALSSLQARGLARDIHPLWIANVISVELRPEALDELARWSDRIDYVVQDIPRPALQAPAWNVSLINADDVWSLSPTAYDGSGVIVAVLDTGVDLDHSDLVQRLWINPVEDNGDGIFTAADNDGVDDDANGFVDDVVGWDFGSNDNDPDDWNGHGTHCAGTVLGDGTGGTATGVAPGARLMALGYSATLVAGQAESWAGMQYALDNGAHIVSFSSGWYDDWTPDYATWRDSADALTDAGVLFVVAAGNDSPHDPPPGDVLTPARVPRAVAVGATDSADVIASFSGQGPTSWEGVTGYDDYVHPPGLLEPDVSAPGVAVLSCQMGGGYINGATWSGTSMAAPHASGVAALLLDEDPALLPHELAYVLRETAVDLGAAGPDVAYGFGRIDALAAINSSYAHTTSYDLSITGTSQVWTTVDIWVDNDGDGVQDDPIANQDNQLYARVRNLGPGAVGNVELKFYYADVGTIGIGGFDPNGDGDPADGNFNYIDSYFLPLIGPAGSSQDTAIGVVHWNVPVPITDHWCVGVGIVAPDPPNVVEADRSNNRAFRNFFDILVIASRALAFEFFVYPDPRRPRDPFDLEFLRKGLPPDFEVDLGLRPDLAEQWLQRIEGFARVEETRLKNLPADPEYEKRYGSRRETQVRLEGDRGVLRGVRSPDGERVRVRLVLRAPAKLGGQDGERLLVINALNQEQPFGGLTLNVLAAKPGRR